jgi:hypothetical protein
MAFDVLSNGRACSHFQNRGDLMQSKKDMPSTRRIDLSNCKLLSTYGRNAADSFKADIVKVGGLIKRGVLIKIGQLRKPGL